MLGLERLAEKAREDARAGIQQRRIDRCVVDIHLFTQGNSIDPL